MMQQTGFKVWICDTCGCTVTREEYSFDLGDLVIAGARGQFTLVPNGLGDQKRIIDDLNNGSCPLCERWEDGNGNLIINVLEVTE